MNARQRRTLLRRHIREWARHDLDLVCAEHATFAWALSEERANKDTMRDLRLWRLVERRTRQCSYCGGHGMEPTAPDWHCWTCEGQGRVPRPGWKWAFVPTRLVSDPSSGR